MTGDIKGKQVNIPVICIDANNRPQEIPTSKWLIKGNPYTIKEFVVHNIQNKIIGVKLWEIDLDGCFPYTTFAITRFGIVADQFAVEAQEAIDKLLEESFVETEILT